MTKMMNSIIYDVEPLPQGYVEQPPSAVEKLGDTDYVAYDINIGGRETKIVFHSRLTTPGLETVKHVSEPKYFGEQSPRDVSYSRSKVGLPGCIDPQQMTVVNNNTLYRTAGEIDSSREHVILESGRPQEILVESGLESLLKAAVILGADNKDLGVAILQARHQRAKEELNHFSELFMAAKLIDENGDFAAMNDTLYAGEVLFIKSLCGDADAAAELHQRLEVLRNIFPNQRAEMAEIEGSAEVMAPDEIALVHTSRYRPEANVKGQRAIRPLMTNLHESRGIQPRTTIHFALNHPVESHMYGNWDNAGYVYVAPLQNVVRNNGIPASLNSIDTFFDVGPFGAIELDGSEVLLMPGNLNRGQIYAQNSNGELRYRADDFLIPEIKSLVELVNEYDSKIDRWSSIGELFSASERRISRALTGDQAVEVYGLELYDESSDTPEQAVVRKQHKTIMTRLKYSAMEATNNEALLTKLSEVGVEGVVSELTEGIEQTSDTLIRGLKVLIEGALAQVTRDVGTRNVILKMGLSVQEAAQWSWRDDKPVKRLRGLEKVYGCRASQHGHSIERALSRFGIDVVHGARGGTITPEEIQRSVEVLEPEQLSRLTLNGWLLAYQLGVLDRRT